jgi:hypothetical protein
MQFSDDIPLRKEQTTSTSNNTAPMRKPLSRIQGSAGLSLAHLVENKSSLERFIQEADLTLAATRRRTPLESIIPYLELHNGAYDGSAQSIRRRMNEIMKGLCPCRSFQYSWNSCLRILQNYTAFELKMAL